MSALLASPPRPAPARSASAPAEPELRLAAVPDGIETLDGPDALAAARPDLEHLLAIGAAAPAHGPAALAAWWSAHGAGRAPRVTTLHRQGRAVGTAVACIDRLRLGPVALRLGRLAGADGIPGLGAAAATGAEEAATVLAAAAHDLLDAGCDAVLLGPIPDHDGVLGATAARCAEFATLRCRREVGTRRRIDLSRGVAGWIDDLPRRARRGLATWRRRLARIEECESIVFTDPDDAMIEFDELVALHEAQRASQGGGIYRRCPDAIAHHRALVAARAAEGAVRLHQLAVGAKVVARHLVIVEGTQAWCPVAARATGPGIDRCGPGRLGLAALLEELAAEGVRSLDLGPVIGRRGDRVIASGTVGAAGTTDAPCRDDLGAGHEPLGALMLVAPTPSRETAFLAATATTRLLGRLHDGAWRRGVMPLLARRWPSLDGPTPRWRERCAALER